MADKVLKHIVEIRHYTVVETPDGNWAEETDIDFTIAEDTTDRQKAVKMFDMLREKCNG